MRKTVVSLVLLPILVFALGLLACSDNNDDDLASSSQSFTIDDGDLTLEISDLKVDPNGKKAWTESKTNFNVTVKVRNVGITSGTYSAVLTVSEPRETKFTEEVFLESGANEMVNFLIVKENHGTYQLELGELKNEFKIGTKGHILNIIIGSIFAIALFLFVIRLIPPRVARQGQFKP